MMLSVDNKLYKGTLSDKGVRYLYAPSIRSAVMRFQRRYNKAIRDLHIKVGPNKWSRADMSGCGDILFN